MPRNLEAQQLSGVPLQVRAREQHEVLGLVGEVAQQPVAEGEVLRGVDAAEGGAAQDPGGLAGRHQGLRVGGDGQHHGDAELASHLGRGHRADVRHAQVQHVDPPGGAQHSADAAAGRDAV